MTVIETQERVASTERVAVRVVDSDVHPVPRPEEFAPYLPDVVRKRYLNHKIGDTINYDAPDYAHAKAMRTDTFPEDGGFPGSDPDLAFRQLILGAGSDIGCWNRAGATTSSPRSPRA